MKPMNARNVIDILKELESVLQEHCPVLWNNMNPGLSEKMILSKMRRYGIGVSDSFVHLYSWKNGIIQRQLNEDERKGMPHLYQTSQGFVFGCIPRETFQMTELTYGYAGYKGFIEYDNIALKKSANRLFPILNNFRSRMFCIDADTSSSFNIKFIDTQWDSPVRDAYETIEDLLLAAIESHYSRKEINYESFSVSEL